MATYESLAQEFKRAGKFDAIRKELLQEFIDSPSGLKLMDKLKQIAADSSISSQPQLISLLSQPQHYIEAERDINVHFLGTSKFKEKLKQDLKDLYKQKYEESDMQTEKSQSYASEDQNSFTK